MSSAADREQDDGVEILGKVRDIEPNKDKPSLELFFDPADADCFPAEHRGEVTLRHDGGQLQGTVGLTDTNPPYLHAGLRDGASKAKMNVTSWLRALGVMEGARLRFRVRRRGDLELIEVVDRGAWRTQRGQRAEWGGGSARSDGEPEFRAGAAGVLDIHVEPGRREAERRLDYRAELERLRDTGGVQEQDLARLAALQSELALDEGSVRRVEREVLGCEAAEAARRAAGAAQTLSGGMTIDPGAQPAEVRSVDVEQGAVVEARFELQRQLGAGGMGSVWLARDVRLDEPVAIKFVHPDHATKASVVERLRREVRLCRPLSHPAIVRVHDFHEPDDGAPFVSMEFVEGQTLRAWLERHGGVVELDAARQLLTGICRGLAYAHEQGVVHLDLKPDNIMVDEGLSRARILDFGIGKASGHEDLDSFQAGTGTPYYMAPEQECSNDVDHRADIFSLGAIAYEVLVGAPPRGRFRAPQELKPEVPKSLGDLVMACLDQDREQRPALGRLQEALAAEEPEVAPLDSATAERRRAAAGVKVSRRREASAPPKSSKAMAISIFGLVAVAIAGFLLMGGDGAGRDPEVASTSATASPASSPRSAPNTVPAQRDPKTSEAGDAVVVADEQVPPPTSTVSAVPSSAVRAQQPAPDPTLGAGVQGDAATPPVPAKEDVAVPAPNEPKFLAPVRADGPRKRSSSVSGLLDSGEEDEVAPSIYSLRATSIDGRQTSLSEYLGKVTLVVNVASQCGYTKQYAGLQKLHEEFGPRGFAVLGFPSNEYGGQEPGTEAEIKQLCTDKFGVTFPMFAKVKTKTGPDQHEVYEALSRATGEQPSWNFSKYLVGKDGAPIAFYKPAAAPESGELRAAIEAALR